MSQRKSAQPSEPAGQAPAGRESAPALQPPIQDHIGRQLRAIYEDVLTQPVPDRFRELMEKLEQTTEDRQ